ncbi:unnamed protein product [Caenorhabditis brenneri]
MGCLPSKQMKNDDETGQNFKFMALPDHVRKMVIINMGAVQMYQISRCSFKTRSLVKNYISHYHLQVSVITHANLLISITDKREVELGAIYIDSLQRKDLWNVLNYDIDVENGYTYSNLPNDQLMKFNGVSMMFRDIELTDEEINSFLKAYIKNETSPNLERMILSADHVLDIDTVLDGLVFSSVEAKDVRISEKHGVRYTNEDGYQIVMKNKEICYVSFCIFGGQETFILANWKDEVHKPLRLLDLPYLAMKQVIESMTLMEVFNLSLTSPTQHHFVKQFFKNQKLKLTIQISDCFLVFLKAPNGSFFSFETHEYSEIEKTCLRMKFGSSPKVPFCFDKPFCLKTFWDDITDGVTELLSLLLDLFNVEFEKLSVHTEYVIIDYGSVVDWINRLNLPIEDYYFGRGAVNDIHYSQILHNKNLKKCKFSQKPSDNFTLPEFRFTDDHVNWQIWNAQWITLDNLSDIGSVSLLLNDLKFTDQEVNLFFKILITGKFKNLEFIYLGLNRMDIEPSVILDGISDLEEENINRNERVFNRHGYDLPLQNTVDVQMTTGETCSFQFYRLEDEDGVNSGVRVIIWK